MGAWQPLPPDLPPEVAHFVEQLRLLKDRTGLSLAALASRTAYSKSSWQRYLNAVQPPPRQAVVALCRVTGENAERFGVRWELAVRVWPRPAAAPTGAEGGGGGPGAEYEDDPTLRWWEQLPDKEPESLPSYGLLLSAGLLVVALLAVALVGTLAFG